MNFQFSKKQKTVFQFLLDQYENSKTYSGENMRNQTFALPPEKICPEYTDNFADIVLIEEFERDMQELSRAGLIRLDVRDGQIWRIVAIEEQIPRYYNILGREDKRERINREKNLYQSYCGKHPVLEKFCKQQIDRLGKGYKAEYPIERAEVLLQLGARILENQEELLERELSILFFSDSKKFEKSYRTAICRILERNGDCAEKLENIFDEREREQILLGEHNIYANPSYIFVKGDGEFVMKNGNVFLLSAEYPIAFSSQALKKVRNFCIKNSEVMTIENLTSFHRMRDEKYFYIYLSGYHNTLKQDFIKRIAKDNPIIKWKHFGDIDPDGFFILENLRKGTGISFEPFCMGVEELKRYRMYGKPLEKNDQRKAETLLDKGRFCEELAYILRENIKLEQEIISLNMKNY